MALKRSQTFCSGPKKAHMNTQCHADCEKKIPPISGLEHFNSLGHTNA